MIAQRTIYATFRSIVKSKYVFTYNATFSYLFVELWFQLFSKCVKDQSTLTSTPTSMPKVYKLSGELFSWNIICGVAGFGFGPIGSTATYAKITNRIPYLRNFGLWTCKLEIFCINWVFRTVPHTQILCKVIFFLNSQICVMQGPSVMKISAIL